MFGLNLTAYKCCNLRILKYKLVKFSTHRKLVHIIIIIIIIIIKICNTHLSTLLGVQGVETEKT